MLGEGRESLDGVWEERVMVMVKWDHYKRFDDVEKVCCKRRDD